MLGEEEYETIIDNTLTGFEKVTDKGLINHPSSDITTGDRVKMEMNRRLKKSINNFNKNSSEQTKRLIKLTEWIIGLTIAMIVGVGAQIALLIYSISK